MSKQIYIVETKGNGYVCGCCAKTWQEEDVIDPSEMISFDELIERAVVANPRNDYEIIGIQYYDAVEQPLYGYSLSYGKDYLHVYIDIGEDSYLLKENEDYVCTKEEVMEKYHLFLTTKGDDEA